MGLFSKRTHIPLDDASVKRIGGGLYEARGSVEKARQVSMWLIDDPGDRELVVAEVARRVEESAAKKKKRSN
jgi:hypothetical protein